MSQSRDRVQTKTRPEPRPARRPRLATARAPTRPRRRARPHGPPRQRTAACRRRATAPQAPPRTAQQGSPVGMNVNTSDKALRPPPALYRRSHGNTGECFERQGAQCGAIQRARTVTQRSVYKRRHAEEADRLTRRRLAKHDGGGGPLRLRRTFTSTARGAVCGT